MKPNHSLVVMIALIVALGGLLMGFDASVISGVNKFIVKEFNLSALELGWAVSSLTIVASLAMLVAGPLSDKFGRRTILRWAAILYAISAIGSAIAPNFAFLVIARMIGGLGVGASLILAPMYIAEIAPRGIRGRLVSLNQLNIVIGISLAFFSNYLIIQLGKLDTSWAIHLKFDAYNWRWMLGLEALPAVLYFIGLLFVPRSPRWLFMKGKSEEAVAVLSRFSDPENARNEIATISEHMHRGEAEEKHTLKDVIKPGLRFVLTIGIVVGVLQQLTGINAVFFYAPMIFEQSGIGQDAALFQAILLGIVNLLFTVLAILFIDKLGRKPLLAFGVTGVAISMFVLSFSFSQATYSFSEESISKLPDSLNKTALLPLAGITYGSDLELKSAVVAVIGKDAYTKYKPELLTASATMNTALVLFAILSFVASFAISLGPVMWVLFSELFPNKIRGIAISFVGLINSLVSAAVQWAFPWELDTIGSATTYFLYGAFAALGLIYIVRVIPETKGKSLEELEAQLTKA